MSESEQIGANQYLTFSLDGEDFAIEIAKVREVLDYTNVTKVPRAPVFLRGVINLRGSVVPVIDLRVSLKMRVVEKTVDSCVVIVDVEVDGETIQMGALADAVQEVVDIEASQISPAPTLGTNVDTEFIQGMGKREDGFLMILDIDKVLAIEDIAVAATNAVSERASERSENGTECTEEAAA
jgi:purine-binding chemotaxis protein CheW